MTGYRFPRGEITAVRPESVILALLTDGDGSPEMAVDGSTTPVVYRYVCSTSEITYIEGITISYSATGPTTPARYGTLTRLTNGVQLGVYRGSSLVLDLTPPGAVRSNAEWRRATCSDLPIDIYGPGNDATWTSCLRWAKGGSVLALQAGQEIRLTVRDNLTGLSSHSVSVSGWHAI